jgi:hypothetical protein
MEWRNWFLRNQNRISVLPLHPRTHQAQCRHFIPRIWGFEGGLDFSRPTKVWRREQGSVIKIRLNNARRRHASRLDCCAACPGQPVNSHALYTDYRNGFPGNQRAVFRPSSLSPLQLTFFTSTVICVHASQINRISLAAVWGTGASRTVVLTYITSIEALLSGKRSAIIA